MPPGASKGTQGLCVWMPFIIRNKNIYGLGVVNGLQDIDFFPIQMPYEIWPWPKIGQGHPRFIIWTNYDGPRVPNATYQFRGNRPCSSREENFWRVFTIYGHGSHLSHVTQGLGRWMCLIIRNKNIYGLEDHWSVPLNASCHKDQEYIMV